jgi:hypothetical protein
VRESGPIFRVEDQGRGEGRPAEEADMNGRHRIAVSVCFMVMLLGGTTARAEGQGARAIEGVWAMSITLRDCSTGAPLGPPFRSLLTFHQGGTVSESPGGTQFAPGQRSPGHGVWSHAGPSRFMARIVAMVVFDTPPAPPAPGFQAGWQLIVSSFTLTDPGQLTLTATTQFYDINRQVYRTACPTGTAERFK